jgi:two-component system, sporulation sensor kinase E
MAGALVIYMMLQGDQPNWSLYLLLMAHLAGYLLLANTVVYFIELIHNRYENERRMKMLLHERSVESALQQSVLDLMPATVLSIDSNGYITSFNQTLLEEYPMLRERDLIDKHVSIITDSYGVDYRSTGIYRALSGEKITNQVYEYSDYSLLVNATPLKDTSTDEIIGAISVSQNVTELFQLRSKLRDYERLGLIGQMAASVAHEIRNPMTSIRGFIQLMSEQPDKPPKQEYYKIVLDELDRVNAIIEDLLTLARNRAIHKTGESLNRLIDEMEPLLWAEANLRGISVEIDKGDIPEVSIDPREIKQLMLNLTRNAMEAMSSGGILKLRTAATDQHVEISVTDTGLGMSTEVIERLFQPFYTTKEHGTGLGMIACLNIAERHEAILKVVSAEHEGTTITVRFPAVLAH